MSLYHHHERVDTPAGRAEATATSRRFSPGQVIGGLVGALMAVVGIIVVVRTGIDGSMNEPVTDILGTRQSAYVGAFEAIVGLMMVAAATSYAYRGTLGFLGALTLLSGVVIAAASDRILLEVGATRSAGTLAIVLGVVALVAAMLPSFVRTERTVEAP